MEISKRLLKKMRWIVWERKSRDIYELIIKRKTGRMQAHQTQTIKDRN
jgi:hypothetical protein